MFDNYIRAFFKKNGITHPDNLLIGTFMEVMIEELAIAEWIQNRERDFRDKVLDRAAEKTATKAPTAKPKLKPDTSSPTQLPPAKPMGGN
jgi:hypothetical protein